MDKDQILEIFSAPAHAPLAYARAWKEGHGRAVKGSFHINFQANLHTQ